MKQAIVNFCKSTDTGLFLLDMPTGFGKTYSVLEFMVDYYDSPEFKDKKIFFVTTLKKNLPDKELREHFAKRGKADDYDKYCLRIEANADMVVEKLDELYRARKIPAAITMKQEFKDLHGSIKLLNEYRDKKRELKGTSRDIINVLCKSAEDAIRKKQEGAFRRVIENELKQFRTPKEKLKNIANNPEYHWIGELYPAVYTREKRIFFMSMDKFFLGNTTIIEPTYSFYNNDITKNAIIFIDEFDATRDRLLNQIITRGLENHIDYLGLFYRVYASLKTRDFPAELTTASKLQQAYLDEHKNAKNPTEIIEGFGGVFDETYDRFAMQYSFKTEEDGKGDRSRNFIFNDLQFHSVFEGENAFIDIDTDMKAKQNWLRFTKRRLTEKEGGVLSLLASVKGCLTYFQNGARNLSFNYKHHKDEDKRPGDDDYTFENAIESVLTEFHLSREQIRYLKPIVMGGQVKSKKDKKDSNGKMSLKYFDRSVYDRGFRYYDFIDDPNHSMRSEIQLFDFQDSPEHILLHLHKMLVQYKKDIADYKSKLKEAQSRPYYNPRHNKPENEPAFFKEMSDECMSRAIAILDTVFKSIESLGGSINSDLSVKIRDDIVRFRMVESQDQVKHEMTKQEAQELVKYNDDIKNHRWASKPQIRKYDKVYNGKLRIEFGERSYIRDNDSEKLEDRLGDILVTLYEKAEENRIVREAREEAERKRVEEARCREENRQRKEQEIRLVKELVNKAEDYRIAKEIREYIQAMIDSGNEDITPEWIEWALKKADWYDPSIETEDEYLGKRQHEKSAEEKEKSLQDSIRKSWYW